MEAVHRTHFDAIHVFALDAVFRDDEGHPLSPDNEQRIDERADRCGIRSGAYFAKRISQCNANPT
jgi:hypothetical protein